MVDAIIGNQVLVVDEVYALVYAVMDRSCTSPQWAHKMKQGRGLGRQYHAAKIIKGLTDRWGVATCFVVFCFQETVPLAMFHFLHYLKREWVTI